LAGVLEIEARDHSPAVWVTLGDLAFVCLHTHCIRIRNIQAFCRGMIAVVEVSIAKE